MKKLMCSLILISVIISISVLSFFSPNLSLHITNLYNGESIVSEIDGQYFCLQDNALYKLNDNGIEKIYTFSNEHYDKAYIKTYHNCIWAMFHHSEDELFVFASSGELLNHFIVPYSDYKQKYSSDFMVDSDTIYFLGFNNITVTSIKGNNLDPVSVDFKSTYDNNDINISKYSNHLVDCYKITNTFSPAYTSYSIHNSSTDEWINSNSSIEMLFDDSNNAISYFYMQKQLINFVYQPISKEAKQQTTSEITYHNNCPDNPFFYRSNSKMMILTSNVISEYPPYGNFDDMKGHKNDNLCIYDIQNHELSAVYKTHRHERIIYADDYKAVTYYKGKYLFRSLDDWSITSKLPADEIKRGGSYTFDSCGDYIFVFDTESGELLNKVNIS